MALAASTPAVRQLPLEFLLPFISFGTGSRWEQYQFGLLMLDSIGHDELTGDGFDQPVSRIPGESSVIARVQCNMDKMIAVHPKK
ncbi:hypothetical protein EJB05_36938 [Eragrostis curvula]|uniref:Uncharacterized protein n=1 Tax=Eragrostis curvula TaxID=38414 RepID=A0A5J9TZH4_9POAL|nr:hypothetical protein EJB05_36938 [Eragrostis curvula]